MTDSFADLWSSSAAIPPKAKPQTLASASTSSSSINTTTRTISKPDAFSLLATTQNQQPRYGSPSFTSGNAGKRSTTNTPPFPPSSITPSPSAGRTRMDAFSDLFPSTASSVTGSSNGNVKSQTGMTLAERLSKAKDSRPIGERKTDVGPQDTAWLGLDSLARSGSGATLLSSDQSRTSGVVGDLNERDDRGLGDIGSFSKFTQVGTSISQPQPRQSSIKPATLWDLQDFASPTSSAQSSLPKVQQQSKLISTKFDSRGLDFDIIIQDADEESRAGRGLLGSDNDATDFDLGLGSRLLDQDPDFSSSVDNRVDDDILGILSQPVEVVKAQTQTQKLSPSPIISRQSSFDDHIPSNRGSRQQYAPSSPPPHVLGQIVEMGFSVEQAKRALANTKDGTDIQAALESLLGNSGGTEARREDSVNDRVLEAQELPPVRRGPPKGFRERELERQERMRRERESEPHIPSGGSDVVSDMQEHADRLLSQASEIGLSVLSKASAFWKEKKGRVVKVYEERAATTATGQKDSVPKWMMDGDVRDGDGAENHSKIKDRWIPNTTEESVQPQDIEAELEVDLFGTGPSKPQSRRIPNHPSASQIAETTIPPFPLSTRDRPLPTASPASLSTTDKHRTAGSSQFNLGQYASAIESYSAAISSLPAMHLLLLPLFNNRALARMRTGEYKEAAGDAAQALRVILLNDDSVSAPDGFDPDIKEIPISSWHPSMEPPFLVLAARQKVNSGGWTHPQGFGVDLVEGYVTALCRRAESSEGRERWSEALKTWEVLCAGDSTLIKEHSRKDAQRNAARCRRMIADETLESKKGDEAPKLKSRPTVVKPRPTPTAPTPPSAALRSLQATNAQAEAEDNLKHQLKDSVDSKLAAWRTGKETNIRALLASLDMVLWEEVLRGARVGGLHELVTPAQVKKGYMKLIARVHPDKLNAQNSTVEQRMLANAVFGTLSEAWTSFQSSNGM